MAAKSSIAATLRRPRAVPPCVRMTHLWVATRENDGSSAGIHAWERRRLDADAPLWGRARLIRAATADGERWVLVGPPSVRVNGRTLDVGIAVLRDADEISTDGERVFFSTESL